MTTSGPVTEAEAASTVRLFRRWGKLHVLDECFGERCWVCHLPVVWCCVCGSQLFRYGAAYFCDACNRRTLP